jgi:hypothetical protein
LKNEVQAQIDISTERIVQVNSGFMPQIDATGVYDRTTNTARVFGTKLNQGMISLDDFNVNLLNDPDSIDNYAG